MDTRALLHRQAVEELYDDYAATFEEHLVDKLDYRGPEIIAGMVARFARPGDGDDQPRPAGLGLGVVVDLGCGTGLCGAAVRASASRLIGIDLSEAMLEVARTKGRDGAVGGPGRLYDETFAADAAAGLAKLPAGSVDHVVAGDMFIYVWSVERVLQACAGALRRGGTLTFTTESMDEGECERGWIERESERFAHSRRFITEAVEAQGFSLEHCERVSLRREPQERAASGEKPRPEDEEEAKEAKEDAEEAERRDEDGAPAAAAAAEGSADEGSADDAGASKAEAEAETKAKAKAKSKFLPAEVFVARRL